MRAGRLLELETLGRTGGTVQYVPYLEFRNAIRLVILKQPEDWHPLWPSAKRGKVLLEAVRAALDVELRERCLKPVKEYIIKNTGLYVALDTAADLWHHTDAIVCCDLGFAFVFVTIDLKVDYDDGEPDPQASNHVIVMKKHWEDTDSRGKLRIHNIAAVIAEELVLQLEWLGILVPAKEEIEASE